MGVSHGDLALYRCDLLFMGILFGTTGVCINYHYFFIVGLQISVTINESMVNFVPHGTTVSYASLAGWN
jgi:hypothetical protein